MMMSPIGEFPTEEAPNRIQTGKAVGEDKKSGVRD